MIDYKTYIGRNVDQLRLEKLLGVGGMGAVFLARHMIMDRLEAVKILPPHAGLDPTYKERFFREAREAAKLTHPNIVKINWMGESNGMLFLAMEFVNGGNVGQLIEKHGRLSIPDAVQMIIPVAEALHYAHSHGIVHRDIKPDNLLLTTDNPPQAKIADFGLVRQLGEGKATNITRAGEAIGTPAFMPLEQWDGQEVDQRTDVFALGVTLYLMVSGRLPIMDESLAAIVGKLVNNQQTPLTDVCPEADAEFAGIVHKAIAPQANNRYATAEAFANALKNWLIKAKAKPTGGSKPVAGTAIKPVRPIVPATVAESPRSPNLNAADKHRAPTGERKAPRSKTPSGVEERESRETRGARSGIRTETPMPGKTRYSSGHGHTYRKSSTGIPAPIIVVIVIGAVVALGAVTMVFLNGGDSRDVANSRSLASNTGSNVAPAATNNAGGNRVNPNVGTNQNQPDAPPPSPQLETLIRRGRNATNAKAIRALVEEIESHIKAVPADAAAAAAELKRLRDLLLLDEIKEKLDEWRTEVNPASADTILKDVEQFLRTKEKSLTTAQLSLVNQERQRLLGLIDLEKTLKDLEARADAAKDKKTLEPIVTQMSGLLQTHADNPSVQQRLKRRLDDLKRRMEGGSDTPTDLTNPLPLPPVDGQYEQKYGPCFALEVNKDFGPYELPAANDYHFALEPRALTALRFAVQYRITPDMRNNQVGMQFSLLDADFNMLPLYMAFDRTLGVVNGSHLCVPGRYYLRVRLIGKTQTPVPIRVSARSQPVEWNHHSPESALPLTIGKYSTEAEITGQGWFVFNSDRAGWRTVRVRFASESGATVYSFFPIDDGKSVRFHDSSPLRQFTPSAAVSESAMRFAFDQGKIYLRVVMTTFLAKARVAFEVAEVLEPTPVTLADRKKLTPADFSGGPINGAVALTKGDYTIKEMIVVGDAATLVLEKGCKLKFAPNTGIEVRGDLMAEGTADAPIVLDAQTPAEGWSGIVAHGTKALLVLRRVTFRNGTGSLFSVANNQFVLDPRGTIRRGGAVSLINLGAEINRLEDCVFENCSARGTGDATTNSTTAGGAIFLFRASLDLVRTHFKNCATDGDGGAVFAQISPLRASDCNFKDNSAGRYGGAIYLSDFTRLQGRNLSFEDNQSHVATATVSGGALAVYYDASARLSECSFKRNRGNQSAGGAIGVREAVLSILDCTLIENQASLGGGVCMFAAYGYFMRTRFIRNTGDRGGGAVFSDGASGEFHACQAEDNRSENGATVGQAANPQETGYRGFIDQDQMRAGIKLLNAERPNEYYFNNQPRR